MKGEIFVHIICLFLVVLSMKLKTLCLYNNVSVSKMIGGFKKNE